MANYNWSPEPKNDLNRPSDLYGRSPDVPSDIRRAANLVICSGIAAAAIVAGAFLYNNPSTSAGKARHAAMQKLDDVEMIPVYVDAGQWRAQARKELAAAGIDLGKTGAEPLYKLEHIVEDANDHKPWGRSGEAHVVDINRDGKFGDWPMK